MRLVEDDIPEVLILSIIKILRKCLVVLEDENAEYLEKIAELLRKRNSQTGILCEIQLYLAEMYRIDGKKGTI